jgi:hypothetical protein
MLGYRRGLGRGFSFFRLWHVAHAIAGDFHGCMQPPLGGCRGWSCGVGGVQLVLVLDGLLPGLTGWGCGASAASTCSVHV